MRSLSMDSTTSAHAAEVAGHEMYATRRIRSRTVRAGFAHQERDEGPERFSRNSPEAVRLSPVIVGSTTYRLLAENQFKNISTTRSLRGDVVQGLFNVPSSKKVYLSNHGSELPFTAFGGIE